MSAITYGTSLVAPRLRLTARGRAVLAVAVAVPLVIAALVFGLGSSGAVATQNAPADSFTWVSVDTNQTLWGLAEALAPDADPREVVADIITLNQLPSADVQPGQRIAIPTEYLE